MTKIEENKAEVAEVKDKMVHKLEQQSQQNQSMMEQFSAIMAAQQLRITRLENPTKIPPPTTVHPDPTPQLGRTDGTQPITQTSKQTRQQSPNVSMELQDNSPNEELSVDDDSDIFKNWASELSDNLENSQMNPPATVEIQPTADMSQISLHNLSITDTVIANP